MLIYNFDLSENNNNNNNNYHYYVQVIQQANKSDISTDKFNILKKMKYKQTQPCIKTRKPNYANKVKIQL